MTNSLRYLLGYFCAPKGCGPSVATEHDLERFLAFGFLVSFDHLQCDGTELLAPEDEDVYWLRKNFLNTVQIAQDAVQDEPREYQGDQDQGGFAVALKDQPTIARPDEPVGLEFAWNFTGLDAATDDEGATLLLELRWWEPDVRSDRVALWLADDALHSTNASGLIEQARRANDAHKTMKDPDVRVTNQGTIFLFTPLNEEGKAWIEENVEDDAQFFGPSPVVEHRFARDLADGMVNDGLQVA